MSTDLVELIHVRLREEIDRCGMSLAAASRAANETSSQRLKDVVSGRQKCPADLIAKLMGIGVDAMYVLTGDRSLSVSSKLAPDEEVLLDEYRSLDTASKKRALTSLLIGEGTATEGVKQGIHTSKQTVSGSNHRVAGRDFITKE
ncbi:hypothetical protein [Pseudomonas sp. WS 5079]|uniref:hypothetical protein n=1 Tax=Pseudomonas sp. WS 5079 TaxID=2717492 RepID=UPI001554CC79|nr:hypothetical protein [Pseudomonas sp. WS 5079]NMX60217.1 hypothetical protein [Pseudomonas sp. WS 5079]